MQNQKKKEKMKKQEKVPVIKGKRKGNPAKKKKNN